MRSIEKNYLLNDMFDQIDEYFSEEEERRDESNYIQQNDWKDYI